MLSPDRTPSNGYLLYKFHYNDGSKIFRSFPNKQEMEWFAHNEGDHLIKVEDLNAS